ncbi:MAG: uncharacterized protein A8A55_2793, partial [Amphiamblys sp. WSBS2006]
DESEDGVFLFPLCQEAHHHACLECLDVAVKDKQELICPICREEGDRFGMDEYKKAISQNAEGLRLSVLITQYQTPDSFSLTQDLPNEAVLLTEKTTVTLSNIEISVKLFFVLLEKTKVTIGERFSIAEHIDSEDCIRDHDMARSSPFCLEKTGGVTPSLTLENIERMPPNSIGCVLKQLNLKDTGLINILPKLRINKDNMVKRVGLFASEKEHVAEILSQDQPIYIGSVEEMTLKNYAVSILPKMRTSKNSEVGFLLLYAYEKEHVAEILSQDQPFCVGRVKNMVLEDYAVSILPKLIIHKDCKIEILYLNADEEEYVTTILAQDQPLCLGRVKKIEFCDYAVFVFLKMKEVGEGLESLWLSIGGDKLWRGIKEEVEKENTAICIEEVEKLVLRKYAVNILPALKTKGEMVDILFLYANDEDQISEALAEEYKGISFGRIKEFKLHGSAVGLLPKMRIGEDCEVGKYDLTAFGEGDVSHVLGKEDGSISAGRVKKMDLWGYAVCVLPKLRIHKDNAMESFVLDAGRDQLSGILEEGDSSIEVGRIKKGGFDVPKKIRRKLRYTLVDGEGKEVLEERSFSQRGNNLA